MNVDQKLFDLNIENILENWEPHHAIRELISNALDESILAAYQQMKIYKDAEGNWHIRDFGRGINNSHFTQNENAEKQNNNGLIGKFGIGLKDALATLYKNNIKIKILSKYGTYTTEMACKNGFDITTLHVRIEQPEQPDIVGTDIILINCDDIYIQKAKDLFLLFNNSRVLESTMYGQVISKDRDEPSFIYINGLRVAVCDDYLFSYNITKIDSKIRKNLNRERNDLSKGVYSSVLQKIILECSDIDVIKQLIADLQMFRIHLNKEEVKYTEVQKYIVQKYQQINPKALFVDSIQYELLDDEQKENLEEDGFEIINVLPNVVSYIDEKFKQNDDFSFNTLNLLNHRKDSSFNPEVVEKSELTASQKEIYNHTKLILKILRDKYGADLMKHTTIKIVKRFFDIAYLDRDVTCLHDNNTNVLYIRQEALSSIESYVSQISYCALKDLTLGKPLREFPIELSKLTGYLMEKIINNQNKGFFKHLKH